MALGASPQHALRLMLGRGMRICIAGLAVGAAAAAAAARLIETLLYAVEPLDPVAFLLSLAILGSAGFLACYVPGRRASRVHPIEALRVE